MEPAEENVGRDSPSVEGLKEEAGLAWAVLEDVELEDSLEGFVLLGRLQAVASWTGCTALDVGVDDIKPSAGLCVGVGFAKVGEGDSVGEVGFFHRCLMAAQDVFSDAAISCPKADAFLVAVLRVEDS